ncbi:MAG: DNA repair protein RadA [Muribaculaceae bacterium]|nr:DNA repair protein RadA [Muribaculaceae bacterium]
MAKLKQKTMWFCTSCGADSAKWVGKCPACGEWNTMVEERVAATPSTAVATASQRPKAVPRPVNMIEAVDEPRYRLPGEEFNRVLGGGLVRGSIVLLGGEPGIGKSTLVLQSLLAFRTRRVLYVSGEESATQIKLRADRIGRSSENVFIVCETLLENIYEHIAEVQPDIVVVDSIQTIATETLDSSAGSVSQVRECAASLLRFAKESGVPVLLIGHINKEGSIAGPKVLEHIVDAVLQFEGDHQYAYRLLRAIKNRFGSTSEIGIYEMCQRGLREVSNPSEMLMSRNTDEALSGVSTGVTLEGIRPFLIEVQALVSTAAYGTQQRSVTGYDPKRMNMLLAVLEKRVGFKLGAKDVFLNIAGGLRVNDPALDLAVIASILSSNVDMAIASGWCMTGEVGLSGEIRPVTRIEQRITEADKLGLTDILIPSGNLKGFDTSKLAIRIHQVARVADAFRELFG